MDMLSFARGEGLTEAGRVTALELGNHSPLLPQAWWEQCHCPAYMGIGNMTSTQGIL